MQSGRPIVALQGAPRAELLAGRCRAVAAVCVKRRVINSYLSCVTTIWSMVASACLILAGIYYKLTLPPNVRAAEFRSLIV